MKLITYEITGKMFRSMSEEEQVLFIQFAHIGNSLAIQWKLVFYTSKDASDEIIQRSYTTQGTHTARILGGMLLEAWNVIRASFYGTALSKTYAPILSNDASTALRSLKKYFDGDNLLDRLRNKFAFHYDRQEIKEYLAGLEPEALYHLYFSDAQGNTLYYMAEEITGMAMMNTLSGTTEAKTVGEVHKQLYGDLYNVAKWFNLVIREMLILMLKRHFGAKGKLAAKEVEIEDGPPMNQVVVPYFVTEPVK